MRILNWVSTWLQNCCCCCTCPKIGSVIQVLQVTKNKVPPFNRSVQVQNTKSPHSFQFILLMFSLTRSSKPCSRSGWLHQYPQSVNYHYPPQNVILNVKRSPLCTCCLFPSAFFLALDPSGCLRFFCVCASFTISSTYNSRIAAVKRHSRLPA